MDSTQSTPSGNNFDPCLFGLFRHFVVRGVTAEGGAMLNSRAWNQAAENGTLVGDCRRCGHHTVALPTEVVGRVTWYSAVCSNGECGHEFASPNGEVLLRSMRHSEMPSGFWQGRPRKKGA